MNKAELLADIEAKSLKVVAILEEQDAVKNGANVRSYIANVMEQNGDRVQGRNIGFYTIDEGTPDEVAYYRDQVTPKSVARTLVEDYMESLRPATFLWYRIDSVDEEQKVARVSVIDSSDMTEKTIVVYKVGAQPITHAVLTTA